MREWWGELWLNNEILIPQDHSDVEALTKVHIICPQESSPGITYLMVQQMGDHRKANFHAVGCDEDVFIDKKMTIANSTS
jgi:hypothetical protein